MFKNFLFLLVLGTSAVCAQVKAPAPSPASKITQTVGLTDVIVEYSRPSMKGRKIFGGLVPFGAVWRTGANANTKVTFDDDVVINGDTLKKGTYALYTKPNAENWEVYFYTDTNNWGNPQQWDDSKVALRTSAKVEKMTMPVETFTISIDDLTNDSGVLGMLWENTYVGVPFKVPTDAKTMASIDKIMSGPGANDYYGAASYYRKAGKDLKQALIWINKATDMNTDAFWIMHEKAQILAALGDKKGAIEAAKKSMDAAQKSAYAQNIKDEYTKMNQDAIAKWSK